MRDSGLNRFLIAVAVYLAFGILFLGVAGLKEAYFARSAQAQDFKTHFKPCEEGMYAAKVKRWIDGDSVILDVYLGFDVWLVDQRARLARVETPERGQPDFKTATDLAVSTCKNIVYVNDGGRDKYGRLLVEMDCDGVRVNDILRKRGWVYNK